uniref:Uncharacterized protein n=1 Tax=Glossina pallidipes TaxID=7398 RepID=A0A1A9ZVY7_GLOPL
MGLREITSIASSHQMFYSSAKPFCWERWLTTLEKPNCLKCMPYNLNIRAKESKEDLKSVQYCKAGSRWPYFASHTRSKQDCVIKQGMKYGRGLSTDLLRMRLINRLATPITTTTKRRGRKVGCVSSAFMMSRVHHDKKNPKQQSVTIDFETTIE